MWEHALRGRACTPAPGKPPIVFTEEIFEPVSIGNTVQLFPVPADDSIDGHASEGETQWRF
jgi:hypothetical protein